MITKVILVFPLFVLWFVTAYCEENNGGSRSGRLCSSCNFTSNELKTKITPISSNFTLYSSKDFEKSIEALAQRRRVRSSERQISLSQFASAILIAVDVLICTCISIYCCKDCKSRKRGKNIFTIFII